MQAASAHRWHFILALIAWAWTGSTLHAQQSVSNGVPATPGVPASPAAPDIVSPAGSYAMQPLSARINDILSQSPYRGLDPLQRATVGTLALWAAVLVDAGRCRDPTTSGGAAETFLFTFGGLNQKVLRPIFDLPESRRMQLLSFAMDIESQRRPADDIADVVCQGVVLPEAAAKSLSERRATARVVLATGLAQSKPAALGSQP
jgi:hypothetical protein